MTVSDRDALAALVGDADEFATRRWAQEPFVTASAHDPATLLTVDDVDRLLASGARRPTFRMVRDGKVLPPERSTSKVRLGGRLLDDVADPTKIGRELAGGATLVLQSLQRTSAAVAELCDRLERLASHPVQANAYLTPAGSTGLGRHRDDHDVLVLHLDGSKAWDVEGLGSVTLTPGDVLYLPAGTEHSAGAVDAHSLHLTIGFLRVTYRAALRRALDAIDDDRLDRPLPFGYALPPGAERLREELDDVLQAAAGSLAGAADDVVAAEVERARPRRRVADGALARALAIGHLGGDDVVRLRVDVGATVGTAEDGERCSLILADRRIVCPAAARPAVETLIAGRPVRVADLPGLDEGSRVVVARRLAREGVVELVAGPDR